jgi:hypothetical protein
MTVLKKNASETGSRSEYAGDLPAGSYDGICVDVREDFGVERRKYRSEQTERCDVIRFEFEVTAMSGAMRRIRTREMKISLHEKSALCAFLSAWCGQPPQDGFDTGDLIGRPAALTLSHVASTAEPGRIFVRIAAIAPGMSGCKVGDV